MANIETDLKIWLLDKGNKTLADMAVLADEYILVRRQNQAPYQRNDKKRYSYTSKPNSYQSTNQQAKTNGPQNYGADYKKTPDPSTNCPPAADFAEKRTSRACYNCGKLNHIARFCPNPPTNNKAALCHVDDQSDQNILSEHVSRGIVNSKPATVLYDTGCNLVIVNSTLVKPDQFLGKSVAVRQALEQEVRYLPLAKIYLHCKHFSGWTTVAAADTPAYDVLFGVLMKDAGEKEVEKAGSSEDVGESEMEPTGSTGEVDEGRVEQNLGEITVREKERKRVEEVSTTGALEEQDTLAAVVTRAQTGKLPPQINRYISEQPSSRSAPTQVREPVSSQNSSHSLGPVREVNELPAVDAAEGLPMNKMELERLQREDPSLEKCRAGDSTDPAREVFEWRNGLLYRVTADPKPPTEQRWQLVLPRSCRDHVLNTAHDLPLTGHFGIKKTVRTIQKHFYWPQMTREIKQFCRNCHWCQLAGHPRDKTIAPLVQVPIVEVPFSRVAMDITGPLIETTAGHKYILVVTDLCTKYPDALPLVDIDSESIAKGLIAIFSRTGFPVEILHDNATNFCSNLMTTLWKMCGIRQITSSIYHPMGNAQVERLNGVLKQMLRKFTKQYPMEWHELLPQLLFAVRSVPHETTGFSPFELLYGRTVRGPLELLKEAWTEESNAKISLIEFVKNTRDTLSQNLELARKNMRDAKVQQKLWYDQKARHREFRPGKEVLKQNPTEERYSTIEREALAVVWSINKLKTYLYGNRFTLVTDHKPLVWLKSAGTKNNRLLRWSLSLQDFEFEVVHRKGSLHSNADGLSRLH